MAATSSFLFASLSLLLLISSAFSCGVPSKLWCTDVETAQKCGVYKQCLENDWAGKVEAPAVSIILCEECMCPDCRHFISDQLSVAFANLNSIMNLTIIPYGNAQEEQVGPNKWKFTCQHGDPECVGHLYETCGQKYTKDFGAYMKWFFCIEKSDDIPMIAARQCAKDIPAIPMKDIEKCVVSPEGNMLEHQMALKTEKLCPGHKYVPWVQINGKHSTDAENKLVKTICKTYTGPQPPYCKKILGVEKSEHKERVLKFENRFGKVPSY